MKFWQKLGLPLPKRLSAFSDCMGKLRPILITGEIGQSGRIDKNSASPLNIEYSELLEAFGIAKIPDIPPTMFRQKPDSYPTRASDKEVPQTHAVYDLSPISSTGTKKCELSNQGSAYKGISSNATYIPISNEDQVNEEWLADYASYNQP